jgi:4-hydroxythreonine-4-phosphate dehydrogenase
VPRLLSTKRIAEVIELSHDACKRFGIRRPKIGVAGLNPHAGEGGLLGYEEQRIIAPAIRSAKRKGINVTGPWPADTLFHKAYCGDFDAVVAMYHDQGLAPLKMIAFDSGVNLTLGLPFVRTSPDHGTAFDIAGKGIANPASMIAAINLAAQLSQRRKATKN